MPAETVQVVDPTHPLYGLSLPLLDITTNRHLGRVCVVQLYPGRERLIPLIATNLGEIVRPPSRCRLSLEAITTLLAVVASLPEFPEEDVHAQLSPASQAEPPTSASPRPAQPSPPTHTASQHHLSRASLEESSPGSASDGPPDPAPRRPGGTA